MNILIALHPQRIVPDRTFLAEIPGPVWTLIGGIVGLIIFAVLVKVVVIDGAALAFSGSNQNKSAAVWQSLTNSVKGIGIMVLGALSLGVVATALYALFA